MNGGARMAPRWTAARWMNEWIKPQMDEPPPQIVQRPLRCDRPIVTYVNSHSSVHTAQGFWHRNGQLGLLRAQVIVLVWLIANLRGHGVSMRLVPFVFYRCTALQ
nr:uncharacterized protein LOC112276418 [Physcomitrium patens]|eukprot:XP_024363480.1 uncharacterized protein LOC112276418 [Physcomitrella patens]